MLRKIFRQKKTEKFESLKWFLKMLQKTFQRLILAPLDPPGWACVLFPVSIPLVWPSLILISLSFFLSFFLCVHVSFFLLLLLLFYLNLSFFVSIWTLTKTRLTLFPVIHLLSFVSKHTLEKVFTIYKGLTFIATKRIFFQCGLKYV